MKCSLKIYRETDSENIAGPAPANDTQAQLVICMGSRSALENHSKLDEIRKTYPKAKVAYCSTSGEIFNHEVVDDSIVATILEFESTTIQTAMVNISSFSSSKEAALSLTKTLPSEGLRYILVLSDGGKVNGSELVKGFNEGTSNDVLVTGGLAGDGTAFQSTLVGLDDYPAEGTILAIGFYGNKLVVSHGSMGGWESFGPERTVTKSIGNKLFEIDDKSALSLYKTYLGDESKNLPASALLFPLSILTPENEKPVVRTILSISEEEGSMTFAGDIPSGAKARFMKANFDKLTSAAYDAASQTMSNEIAKPVWALLVSCVGRKIILGPRTEEEVEAVREFYGDATLLSGFYSYGEISPLIEDPSGCAFHNQTMTITSFYEL
ncbi:MAG: FIST signal transduction protein [Bacteroidota bacterium]|jgi:hypothetical protein